MSNYITLFPSLPPSGVTLFVQVDTKTVEDPFQRDVKTTSDDAMRNNDGMKDIVKDIMEDTDNGEEEEVYTSSNSGSYDNRSSLDLLVNFNIFLQLFILICCLIFPTEGLSKTWYELGT